MSLELHLFSHFDYAENKGDCKNKYNIQHIFMEKIFNPIITVVL